MSHVSDQSDPLPAGCRLCSGWGGWYDAVEETTPALWVRCIVCGGSGDQDHPQFPVSNFRDYNAAMEARGL